MMLVYALCCLLSISSAIPQDKTFPIDINSTYNASDVITSFSPEVAIYYAGFVGTGYCYESQILKGKCCNEQIEFRGWKRFNMKPQSRDVMNFLYSHIEDRYNFQILFSDIHQKVLLLFPGTRTESQLYAEFFEYAISPFDNSPNAKIYFYFNKVYTLFKTRVFTQLDAFYRENPKAKDYQTIFQGHSLGAAMALIFAEAAVEARAIKRTEVSPVLITLGQPRVGNSAFVEEVAKNIPIYFRIVHMGDPIADLPPQTIQCLGGTPDCPQTEYIFIHGEGLKLLNANNTEVTECYQSSPGKYSNSLCVNKVADYSSFVPHTHYFWNKKKITGMCPPNINA